MAVLDGGNVADAYFHDRRGSGFRAGLVPKSRTQLVLGSRSVNLDQRNVRCGVQHLLGKDQGNDSLNGKTTSDDVPPFVW